MILKTMAIPAEAEGRKLGNYLRQILPNLPESVIRKAFASRDVKLDGLRVSADTVLHTGQELKIYLPDTAAPDAVPAAALDIVYEDDSVLLINKRAGISVEKDNHGGITLSDLCASYIAAKDPAAFPPPLVTGWTTKPAAFAFSQKRRKRSKSCRIPSAAGRWKNTISALFAAS
jgi:23S rRNA pseudouridine955/2504/2580 synthase